MENEKHIIISAIAGGLPDELQAVLKDKGEWSWDDRYGIKDSKSLEDFFAQWRAKDEKTRKKITALCGDPFLEMLKATSCRRTERSSSKRTEYLNQK